MYDGRMGTAKEFGTIIGRNGKRKHYEARYPHPYQRGKKVSRNFPDKASARSWLSREYELVRASKMGQGEWTSPSEREQIEKEQHARQITLAEYAMTFADKWVGRKEDGTPTATGTQRKRREYITHLMNADFVDKAIGAVTCEDINRWLSTTDLQSNPRLRTFQTLKLIYKTAVDEGLVTRSPVTMKAPKLAPSQQAQIPVATPEELKTIYDHMPEYSRISVYLGAVFDLRINEVCALRVQDIDLNHHVLHIRHAVDPETRKLKTTKSASSTADLPIPHAIIPMLEEQIGNRKSGPLIISPHSEYMNDKVLRRQFDKAKQFADRPDLHFHTLRATAITAATHAGATVAETMAHGRHSDVATSVARYQRASTQRLAKISEKVADNILPHTRTIDEVQQEIKETENRLAQLKTELARLSTKHE